MELSAPAAAFLPLISGNLSRLGYSSSTYLPAPPPPQFRSRFHCGKHGFVASLRLRNFPRVEAKKQTFSSFDELLANSDKPVLVDFYATWCGPCQFMVPVLDQVSTILNDKIQVVKIDTEKYPRIANTYKIEALPTFIIFKDGEPYDRFEGALAADQLIQRIKLALKEKS
ncbi:hypothetical protein Droror1_Dr00026608 [Drosera rotundifolia]